MPSIPHPHRLILRGDDAGSFPSANAAILQCIDSGHLRNVSVMACGPAMADLAPELLQRRNRLCLGLHLTLNAEWPHQKWGPLAGAAAVPDLVDTDGFFTPRPDLLAERHPPLSQVLAELEAQLAHLRDLGLNPDYLDEHMGVGGHLGCRRALADFCKASGLIAAEEIPTRGLCPGTLPETPTNPSTKIADYCYLSILHPCLPGDDLRLATGSNQVGLDRDRDRNRVCNGQWINELQQSGTRLITYRDWAETEQNTIHP